MDFAAWMEVWLGDRWWTFDPRNNARRKGRVVIGRGRDATDVAVATTFGGPLLESMTVQAEELALSLAGRASPAPAPRSTRRAAPTSRRARRPGSRDRPRAARRRPGPATSGRGRSCRSSRLCQTSRTLTSLSRPVWATKITSAAGQAPIAAKAPPVRGGSRLGIAAARSASSAWPARRSRSMPRRQRSGVQFPPSGNSSSASRPPRPAASRLICLIWSAWGLPPRPGAALGRGGRRCRNALGTRLATMSRLGSSWSVAFMTTRGRRSQTVSRWCTSSSESPGPACRLSTMSGRSSASTASGGAATSTLSPQARRARR